MNNKNILFIGATGLLGKPVVKELLKAGFHLRALVRRPNLAKTKLPPEVELVQGDIFDEASLGRAIQTRDIIYLNLSIAPDESESQMHTEKEGLDILLKVAREKNTSRIAYLSSIVRKYQGMNGFNWWVFDIKHQAVEKIKKSGLPYFIYNPSAFMENYYGPQRRGNKLALAGKSKHPMWFIAGEDYGKQVVRSLSLDPQLSREFSIQGLKAYRSDEAADVYIKNFTAAKLSVMFAPIGVFKVMGMLMKSMNYLYHIMTALNEYPEQFESEETWNILGKPSVTLEEFAKRSS
ncbi:MAG: NAD(P)H-binding protein [Xanthomonadaceae bacterium]|nr:NAD(P)H-binding protein [Xanthomonadaceae bacterium]